ncbi:MAG: flagellar hook-associated protein FlgL [Gammaproteobacteria bacterium]|nr:flagellar hook-associated protein FlgL [Gammaproteobacteria bacterium]MBU1553353.1 flagellar hook-associated protein FlgL [Gammaproteobacteria bacterium]MBU2070797.1 flagellar hook-associated protein FlgL [Gammaproteobacteria bacterium]MBU2182788.1 flagellar hook-associated protein FlgL [Gammaproteobacteria bacterium]MBU2205970.1 flagellar hook-associated protein FlgL [Gammaproteobacteria bacterium]
MRVSSNQYHLTTIRNIQQTTAEYSKLSTQLATNQRIQKPSDDPLGSVMLLTLNGELTKLEQYQANMDAVHFNLGQQESQLNSIVNTLFSVQEIVTTAADGAMGQAELQAFAQELSVLFPAIVDLLNAKDGNGNYYFSGSLTGVKPFEPDAGGVYQYLGDDSVRQVAVSDNSSVPSNILGSDLVPGVTFLNEMQTYLDLISTAPVAGVGTESRDLLGHINDFMASVSGEVTRIGGTLASLDEMALGNADIALFTEQLRDDIKEVDYPEAYVNMNQALASYESSLKVYSSVSKLTLFSYV